MLRRKLRALFLVSGIALLALFSTLVAADAETKDKENPKAPPKEATTKGQVQVGSHAYKMESGKLYFIRVEGQGFTPIVSIRPGYFRGPTKNSEDIFETYFMPQQSKSHRIFILPTLNDEIEGGALDYKISFKPIPLAKKPLLEEKGTLKSTDPIYKGEDGFKSSGPHKAYTVKLKARQLYVIDMERTGESAERSDRMDPYLMLEGPGGKIVASDDDGGIDMNARIIIQPRRAGEHKIIATITGKPVGDFTVRVRTTE